MNIINTCTQRENQTIGNINRIDLNKGRILLHERCKMNATAAYIAIHFYTKKAHEIKMIFLLMICKRYFLYQTMAILFSMCMVSFVPFKLIDKDTDRQT